ncbi:MAG: type I-C CRISPR-associated protein Cas8c/Csd1 [Alphaproteobacteria bacterium]
MTILQSLAAYYDRLRARGEAAEPGYAPKKISYELVIDKAGRPISFNDIRDISGKKPAPRILNVPSVSRTSGIEAAFLWDKTSYSLGITDLRSDPEQKAKVAPRPGATPRSLEEHAAFKSLHESALANTTDEGLLALREFLKRWTPELFVANGYPVEALDQNIVFRLDGEFGHLHEKAAARMLWHQRLQPQSDAPEMPCLITGKTGVPARLHPTIQGVRDAQSSGAALSSFNLRAFTSYDKEQGENAPVSASGAFAYGTALNKLLSRDSGRNIIVGDATCAIWADAIETGEDSAASAESFFGAALDPSDRDPDIMDAGRLRAIIDAISCGRPVEGMAALNPRTRMHVLGLAPNAGRISVRFWHVGSLGSLAGNLSRHWGDLDIDPSPFKRAPSVWALLYETAVQRKSENIPPKIGGDLMRAVLGGERYPMPLLSAVIGRIRADGDVNGVRAAICKAVIQRNLRLSNRTEEIPVALDKQNMNPAYRLGRLFALFEWAETGAGKRNATIRDKYFASASTTPARVFPLLMRGSTHNLAKLRKGSSTGLAVMLDKEITEVLAGLDDQLPASLRLEEQGRFVIGYYHQAKARFAGKQAESNEGSDDEQEN